ncbi:uncharacterized protein LOC116417064 [Nasonia vitripennis]|uniref:CCHC-type domain-containing protein n=1 Tax=Nasonia vitripennis TaxID=7425 RepID=A0A7M7QBQ7_NASVI|nr:uncharacterized protein LOC116417064 [Nasonia vitripennis]
MADAAAELVKQKRISGFLLNFKCNTARLAASACTLPHMRTRLSLLESYWSEYTLRDLVLQANRSAFKGEAYFENDEYLEVESSYVESKADVLQSIEDLEIAARPPVTAAGAQNNQVVHAPPVPGPSKFANMPKCQIPKFSGKAEEWETFKEQFSSMVKNKANLPDAIKMQYLVDSVERPAALRVKGLPLTGASFEFAWQKLMRRYDNPTRRMHTYMELLIDMKPVKRKSSGELMELLDKAEAALKTFKNVGCPCEHWDSWLIHMVERKLDNETREGSEWRISQESVVGFSTFSALTNFFETRASSLDQDADDDTETPTKQSSQKGNGSNRSSRRESVSVNATSTSFAKGNCNAAVKCSLCRGPHQLQACPRFNGMSTSARFEHCKKERLCLNCLRSGHFLADCTSQNRCANCKGRHHTKIHSDRRQGGEAADSSNSTGQKGSSSAPGKSSMLEVSASTTVVGRTRLMATAKVLLQS